MQMRIQVQLRCIFSSVQISTSAAYALSSTANKCENVSMKACRLHFCLSPTRKLFMTCIMLPAALRRCVKKNAPLLLVFHWFNSPHDWIAFISIQPEQYQLCCIFSIAYSFQFLFSIENKYFFFN